MPKPYAGRVRPTLVAFAALLCAGCASTQTRKPGDPLEPANRGVYKFNDALDRAILKPTAKGYDKVTPNWLKTGIGNFFTNLSYPFTIVNQVLQGKLKAAGQDTARFLINTTLGWGGVLDVASGAHLPHHDEDLGQTMGVWGVPPGPYLMVPFLGPSSVRDLPSRIVDSVFSPLGWSGDRSTFYWVAQGIDVVDTRARLLPLDAALNRVFDKYGFIRDAYLQQRNYAVHDGDVPEDLLDEELVDPDPGADDAAPGDDTAAGGAAAGETVPADPGATGGAGEGAEATGDRSSAEQPGTTPPP
jgi:phospholipid-binding lipoprotein MlaA